MDTVSVVKVPGVITTVTTPEGEIVTTVAGGQRGLTGPAGLPVDILATAPASPTEGYTYYNTTDNKLWFWNGTAWVDVTDAETFDGQDSPYYLNRDNHTGPSAAKATPVDADNAVLLDSAASGIAKKLSWANIKATLKTYFDTLYAPIAGAGAVWGAITGTLSSQTDLQAALDAKQNDIVATDGQIIRSDGANNPTGSPNLSYDDATGTLTLQGSADQANAAPYFVIKRSAGQTLFSFYEDDVGGVIGVHATNGVLIGYYKINPLGGTSGLMLAGYNLITFVNQGSNTAELNIRTEGNAGGMIPANWDVYSWRTVNFSGYQGFGGEVVMRDRSNGKEVFHARLDSVYDPKCGITFKPSHLSDAEADLDMVYYSTDVSKLSYKDPGGTINRLY